MAEKQVVDQAEEQTEPGDRTLEQWEEPEIILEHYLVARADGRGLSEDPFMGALGITPGLR
jgi:hypothetical protein